MPRQTLQFPITLPGNSRRREICTRCLSERLTHRPGIYHLRVVENVVPQQPASINDNPDQRGDTVEPAMSVATVADEINNNQSALIELDYDSDMVSLSQINGYLRQAGGCLHQAMAHVILPVSGLVSPRQEHTIAQRLHQLPGVQATVSFASQTIRLEFDRRRCALPQIVSLLEEIGVEIKQPDLPQPNVADSKTPESTGQRGAWLEKPGMAWVKIVFTHHELLLAIFAGVFLLAGAIVHWTGGAEQLRIALLLASYVCGGFFPAQEMVKTLARLRLDIDLLMFAAAFGAAALGHYEEGAMLLFLFSLGGAGEELAMSRARNAIEALTRMSPKTALRVESNGRHEEVPVEDLRVHDLVFVAPGQLIPADGTLITGNSAINQASITGESIPVEKGPGEEVFAGTLNGDGALTLEVRKLASDNTLAKVIRLVREAQTTKSPTQLFTDKVEAVYVPLVIVVTILVMTLPPALASAFPTLAEVLRPAWFSESPWKGWFYQSMAFLTAASPCALAIGTPAAILSGIGRAARGGVLIKGGIHLENLAKVRAIAFDKTGTLTRGKPVVSDIQSVDANWPVGRMLAVAGAVERGSKHPLALAVVQEAENRRLDLPVAIDVQQKPGMGISGMVRGQRISITRPAAVDAKLPLAAQALAQAVLLEDQGQTVVVMLADDAVVGLIALADQPRPEAHQALLQLKQLGIDYNIMLTGDNSRTAAAIGKLVGIDEHLADLLPEDKLTQIDKLSQHYGKVAMVGDGVNDAPALAHATVGIAIGGAGGASDVALETADVVLLASDLRKLAEAVGVSRFSRRIIMQNLILALGVIAVVSPLAALGLTNIALAVLLHEGSTVLVVLNSLRILRYKQP